MSPKLLTDVYYTLNDGKKVPAFGLGTYNEDESQHHKITQAVITAIEEGVRHIDTAWYYETEPYIGKALKDVFDRGIVKREDLFITTKVWPSMHDKVEKSLDRSLEQLGVDYVDLFLQHWPLCFESGPDGYPATPVDDAGEIILAEKADYLDTYRQMEEIYHKTSKIKSLGVANFPVRKLKQLLKTCKVKPVNNQIECHPEFPQTELGDFCAENDIIVTAYSPLGGGGNGAPLIKNKRAAALTEKYKDYNINEILYSYHIQSGRIVIPKSLNPKRIQSVKKLVPLTKEDIEFLESGPHKRYTDNPWYGHVGFGY
ncbi:hypothetical protein PACTADRAFT_46841 [Pachysolen tannophilus NRRL Y-2460]|uniref:NADP-dependent oxidoreductase domain-containing protein n=1 Tax=Pachysolen tannophilus NRRL Y-2460 TaxID=669874 RepID=A0A1E4TP19_PACTA|nr:hypothetical protein PACTADRAFT_46841 [Pachysolen tannophilus NRRL Y-2460]